MPTLSQRQLARLWIQAGGDPSQAGIASAVAMAESSGNTAARNHNTNGSTDLGGWQINNKAHPEYNEQQLISNPLYNAKAAVAISNNGKDWSPWVTYTTGAYKKFLSGFRGPSRSTTSAGSGGIDPLGGIEAVGHFFSDLTEPSFWLRVGKVVIGGVVIIIALDRLTGIKAVPVPV